MIFILGRWAYSKKVVTKTKLPTKRWTGLKSAGQLSAVEQG